MYVQWPHYLAQTSSATRSFLQHPQPASASGLVSPTNSNPNRTGIGTPSQSVPSHRTRPRRSGNRLRGQMPEIRCASVSAVVMPHVVSLRCQQAAHMAERDWRAATDSTGSGMGGRQLGQVMGGVRRQEHDGRVGIADATTGAP